MPSALHSGGRLSYISGFSGKCGGIVAQTSRRGEQCKQQKSLRVGYRVIVGKQ